MPARPPSRFTARAALCVGILLVTAAAACGRPASPPTTVTWLVGQAEPRFDPAGPSDPVRWALERLLSQGLVSEDSAGRIVPAAARRWDVTPNGLTYTFTLRPGLRFEEGGECTSADFRRALEAGLNRLDHSTYAWLLSPVVGVDRVRAGRPLPPLGIATPDERTVVLRLARADPMLLHKLALPGASAAWREGAGWAGGVGPYRVVLREPGRQLVLARRAAGEGPDTVRMEFAVGAARARASLRRGRADLLWPVPPGMLAQALPADCRAVAGAARPARRLWLVMRGDLHPTRRTEARRALAHGLNRAEILARLGTHARAAGDWLPGGAPFEFPRRDAGAVREWLQRGRLGRALHVVMAYAADGAGAEVARAMQSDWAEMALDVELRPMRRAALAAEALRGRSAHLILLESQAPFDDPIAELAALVEPQRRPAVGGFRTGWSTREFDRWIGPRPDGSPFDVDLAERRLAEELVALPLARLDWLWVERPGAVRIDLHPRFGPEIPGRGRPLVPA